MATVSPMLMVQPNPSENRRQALASAMMGGALQNRPMRTGWEALGSLANAYVGAKMGAAADASYQQRQNAARETLADAMTQMKDPSTPYATGMDAFYGTLASNPDTANLAATMQLQGILNQQEAAAQPPKLVDLYDPESPTGASKYDVITGQHYGYSKPGAQGLQIGFSPEGGIESISMGGISQAGDVSAPTAKTVGDVQAKAFNSDEIYNRLGRINQLNQPEYQTFGGRLKGKLLALQEKASIGNIDDQEKLWLRDFTRYQTATYNNLNQTLKEMSGAAINAEEAKRLLKTLPDPGEGIFDGDSATEFQSKVDEVMSTVRQNMLRYNVWMKVGDRGGNPWDMPFTEVGEYLRTPDGKGFINSYAYEAEKDLSRIYSDPAVLRDAVKQRLRDELWFM